MRETYPSPVWCSARLFKLGRYVIGMRGMPHYSCTAIQTCPEKFLTRATKCRSAWINVERRAPALLRSCILGIMNSTSLWILDDHLSTVAHAFVVF